MQIKKLELQNFRCFEHLDMDFHCYDDGGGLTVLVAENGKGKTTVLDSISFILGRFLLGFSNISNVPYIDKRHDMRTVWARMGRTLRERKLLPARVALSMTNPCSQEEKTYAVEMTSLKITRLLTRALRMAAQSLENDYSVKSLNVTFPLVAYYNTERAIVFNAPKRLSPNRKKAYSPLDAYDGALKGFLDFRRMVEWVAFQEDKERREMIRRRRFNHRTLEMHTIQTVIECILPGFHNLHSEIGPRRLMIDYTTDNGTNRYQLDEELSDGQRVMLTLALDLTSRMLEANGENCKTPQEVLNSPGIVLIDEIELHLHPSWQQHVLIDLQKAFPKIQFVVTTHSPQVVSSVPRECLRILDGQSARTPDEQTEGEGSQNILANIFGTAPTPSLSHVPDIHHFAALVAQGQGDTPKAEELLTRIKTHFGENYPMLSGILAQRDFLRSRNRRG